ncbi:MAG: replication-associated recombination protein A [Candidatus Aminicenantes bacterium]|nr:replication-associated recombination protein A [Candidatus Aminicenantes bacterium]
MNNIFPLAEKLRPRTLDDCEGQEHLISKGKILRSFVENDRLSSLIFWGPPGTGKTTISKILVNNLHFPSIECSATISSINQIRNIMKEAIEIKEKQGKPLVVFVDEIHHFNKHSQDAFLPFIEKGDIILIGTTIENPAYKINRALLSRLKIVEFYGLGKTHLKNILKKAADYIRIQTGKKWKLSEKVENIILDYSTGDARRLLNLLEILVYIQDKKQPLDETFVLEVIQKKLGAYDRSGDDRFQLISAFHKSVRNSDCDSALFWLYRMMEGGEDPLYIIRRMIRIAVEDIGFADSKSLTVCLNTKDAYEFLGSPEGDLFLTQATIYLSSAPKSNSLYLTEEKMRKIVEKYRTTSIPLHLINPADFISSQKGAGKGYLYAHHFKEKTTTMKTLPEEVKEKDFFVPNDIGFEKKIKDRLEYWKKTKTALKNKKK